jgi:predicted nuclease of restriction endonuclease-like (RecB) superfamily
MSPNNINKITKQGIEDYNIVLNDIKSLLNKAKANAYKAVDNVRVQTYWQVGERIVREELRQSRADYGRSIIEQLSKDIGLSGALIWRLVQFYKAYPILVTVSRDLSWSHYEVLITIKNKEERDFYEAYITANKGSSRDLRKAVRERLSDKFKKGFNVHLSPSATKLMPNDVFKSAYNFDFLELKKDYNEKDLKDALLKRFEEFVKELGNDFFVGRREVPILISGNYDKVDLELFHAGLMCYILVEIKTEPFRHSHVSQMYSYLNWYKKNKLRKSQNMPVGLIICKSKDEETVHYALGELKREIFVSEYKLKLPSEKEIIEGLG